MVVGSNPAVNVEMQFFVWVCDGHRFDSADFDGHGIGHGFDPLPYVTLCKTLRKALRKCKVAKTLRPYTLRNI